MSSLHFVRCHHKKHASHYLGARNLNFFPVATPFFGPEKKLLPSPAVRRSFAAYSAKAVPSKCCAARAAQASKSSDWVSASVIAWRAVELGIGPGKMRDFTKKNYGYINGFNGIWIYHLEGLMVEWENHIVGELSTSW